MPKPTTGAGVNGKCWKWRPSVSRLPESKKAAYPQSVYIPYADIWNRADEVILGTNYEKTDNQRKAEVFRYQMKQKCPDVKVSRSTLPINPPNK